MICKNQLLCILLFIQFKYFDSRPLFSDKCPGIPETVSCTCVEAEISKNITKQLEDLLKSFITSSQDNDIHNSRVKRQVGGKYTEAAKMPQIKLFRMVLQIFKNLWADEYVGGSHPLHPVVPKRFVKLYKETILEFFFPDVGETVESKKNKKKNQKN